MRIVSFVLLIPNLLFSAPGLAGQKCRVFEDIAQSEIVQRPSFRRSVQKICKDECSAEEAQRVYNQLQKEKAGPKNPHGFKSSDAHHRENEQVHSIVRDLQMTREQQRRLHDEITGQGLSRREILERAQDLLH
ncbi:MAG: hypothetical protein ACAH59_02550 [Pseudobdellovibrionaceae bacterium]